MPAVFNHAPQVPLQAPRQNREDNQNDDLILPPARREDVFEKGHDEVPDLIHRHQNPLEILLLVFHGVTVA